MLGIHRIIVPIDFNRHSDALAEFALYIASKFNAKVTFVHVTMQLPDYADYEPDTLLQVQSKFLAHAEKKMAAFMNETRGKYLECEGEVLSGDTVEALLSYTRESCADLVIIATHGAQGIEKILLGSVAERVIKSAPCPTLVFNPFKNERGYEVCSPLSSCLPPS